MMTNDEITDGSLIAANLQSLPSKGKGEALLLLFLVPLAYLEWVSVFAFAAQYKAWLPEAAKAYSWPVGYTTHLAFIVSALCGIAMLWRYFPSDFGLRWPTGRSYIGPALVIGVAFGPLMLLVDYYPELLAHTAPLGPYDTAASNVVPWLVMQGIFVGPSEELVFRSLMLGFALCLYNRQVRLGRFSVSIAAIVLAFAFSLAHVSSFWETSFVSAMGQQVYVVVLGIFYGWLFERSGSLLAPAIAHNAGDFVEWSLCFVLRHFWH